jgi:NADH dehydrogenase (ubiquinone) 1 beta subcomplex subunit 7
MDAAKLQPYERDYCAHTLIEYKKCQSVVCPHAHAAYPFQQYAPFASWACQDARHGYDSCEAQDFLLRLKEYERERRLLLRHARKIAAGAIETPSLGSQVVDAQ